MADLDVLVVGGGQAGLAVGYHLRARDVRYAIFERGRIGETWRTQRWDSFAVNTPNWANVLPGDTYVGDEPDGFRHRDELVADFERYADAFDLPVVEGRTVIGIDEHDDGFLVTYHDAAGAVGEVTAANVVVASGMMQSPKIPAIQARFPESIVQLHASGYRSPEALPSGAVVIVGSGQSGCQIATELARAGRDVFLCTSKVARVRRRYRRRDILAWADDMGFWDVTVAELADPAMQFAAQPQVSGVGRFGSTVSLQSMAADGVHLMGRLSGVEDGVLTTDDDLAANIVFADDRSAEFTSTIEAWIARKGIQADPIEDDPADEPAGPDLASSGLTALDLREAGVGSVIWCTGFTADLGWIHIPVTDADGRPIHTRGVSPVAGLHFMGLPWLHTRKSSLLHGVDEDARFIVDAIEAARRP